MSNQSSSTSPPHTLIIGSGVIGLCTAYYLTQQGHVVTILDKAELGAGSSYGNAGWVAVGHALPIPQPGVLTQGLKWLLDAGGPFYIKPRLDLDLLRWLWHFQQACTWSQVRRTIPVMLDLNRAGLALFRQLAAEIDGDFGFVDKGLLYLYRDQASFAKGVKEAKLLRPYGTETALLDHAGLRALEPNLSPHARYGIYYRDYAHLQPHNLLRQLAQVVQQHGVTIHYHTEVLGFTTTGRQITSLQTTRGDFRADQIVLAAGAWSPGVVRDLQLSLPIQAAKGYSLTFKRPPHAPTFPCSVPEYKAAITPMGNQLRISSTLELAGLDATINQRRLAAIRQAARDYLIAGEELELLEIWRGFRPLTPDDLPFIGRSPQHHNLVVATGHGMLGVTQGTITGKLVAQLIAEETPLLDLKPFRVNRFE
jgi:D-amino-acid dehydrogenase